LSAETPYKLSITAFLRGRCLHTVQARKAGTAASGIGREQHQPGNIMNILARHGRALLCSTGFIVLGLLDACGGGDQGRDPILGLPTANVVSVTVTPATAALPVAGTVQLTAVANYADGSSHDVTTASAWTSATPAVASVSASGGLATGVSAGSSVLSASFGGKSGSATLTVNPALPLVALTSVTVTPATAALPVAGTVQLTAVANYADGSSHDVTALSAWTSATPAVASVSASGGLATGVSVGSSVLSASFGGQSGSATLTVNPAVLLSIALTPVAPSIAIGATQQFIVNGSYSDGSSRNVGALASYVSATPSVATIGGTTGLASSVSAGSTLITASLGTLSASATLTVTPATLVALAITPAHPTLPVGGTQQLTVIATYSDGSTVDVTRSSSYSSASSSMVGVGASTGLSTGLASGSSVVSASFGGQSVSTTVTVAAVTLTSLAVTPANASIAVGATQQFVATGTYSDGSTTNLSGSVAWTSGTVGVGTIVPGGLASAVAAGNSTITATSGAASAHAVLTVTPVVVVGPGSGTINLGGATNFGVLAGTAITNNSGGATLVTGNVGSPSQTVDPVVAAGYTDYKSGAILTTALGDLQVAITSANQMTCDVNSAAGIDLGGRTFTPGVYCYAGAISITGTFTMNGPGQYVFRTASTMNTVANSIVAFTGGATAGSVYWVPVAATTLGANSVFQGSVLAQSGAITMGDSATLHNGRLLSGTAVTLKNNPISIP